MNKLRLINLGSTLGDYCTSDSQTHQPLPLFRSLSRCLGINSLPARLMEFQALALVPRREAESARHATSASLALQFL